MIRFVVGLFIFAVALCAYIINAQHGGVLPQAPERAAPEPAPIVIEEEPQAPEPHPLPVGQTAAQVLESIVARELSFQTASIPVVAAVHDTLVVLGLEDSVTSSLSPDKRFATLVGEALKAGTPDTDIIETIAAKARAGDIAVPAGLVTADHQIDTPTYLKAIVTTAVLVAEGTEPVVPDLSNDPTAIIAVHGYDYVVTASDSLAAIAVKFYGDVAQTSRIIQANPIALAKPDHLTAGTTIKIPAF